MQKVVAFLEKYVQWVAIAIGAAFMVWMVYGYVVTKPVTVPVAGFELTPGQVDDKTFTGPARTLKGMTDQTSAPTMPVQNFGANLADAFNNNPTTLAQLNKPWTSNFYGSITNAVEADKAIAKEIVNPVVALPAVPAALDLKTSDGRSTVIIPPPVVAGAAPAVPLNPKMNGVDVNWISVSASIPVKKLNDAFVASKIPTALNNTTLLRVELDRQELNGDGTWGEDTVVEPLKNVTLLALPAANASQDQAIPYKLWAESAQVDLAQPAMYAVVQGDPWRIPGGQVPPDAAALAAEANFDPAKVTNPRDLTPDQRKQYEAYQRAQDQARRDKAKAAYQQRKGGAGGLPPGGIPGGIGGPGGPGGGFGGGGGGFGGGGGSPDVATDNTPPILLAQSNTGGMEGMMRAMQNAQRNAPGGFPGGFPGDIPPGMEQQPGMPQPGAANTAVDAANGAMLTAAQATLPKGAFDPSNQPDIVVWAHDATIMPGKTYRYRISYTIKNPVFATGNVCKPAALADQFLLASEPSDWTEAVSVKSVTNFYAVNTSPTKESVKFDIFRWKNGSWQVNTIDATPGDMVGSPKGDGDNKIDFSTGWTLVDVRSDPRNADNRIIILTTDTGQILRKDLTVDRSNPEYKNLKTQTDAGKGTATGVGGSAPGARAAGPTAAIPGGAGFLGGGEGRQP